MEVLFEVKAGTNICQNAGGWSIHFLFDPKRGGLDLDAPDDKPNDDFKM
jgi:hypothetical protein